MWSTTLPNNNREKSQLYTLGMLLLAVANVAKGWDPGNLKFNNPLGD